jgi:tetratricopeptide (TPR) repeat protein
MDTIVRCANPQRSSRLLAIQGVTLLEKLGSSDGRWRVRLERLGDCDAPMERKVSAAAIGALPNWPFLGVSVACLRAFARAHEALLVDATTEDVCERVCKPLTDTAGDSLAACLVRLGAADPVTGVPLAAAPTIFVSHARQYLFRDLVDAVCAHVSSLPEEEHDRQYVWLDIFSQYQHWIGDVGTAQRPCNWDVVFQLTTAAIGHTCLVFAPWRDAVPLRRAWMLWEVLCTLTAQGTKGAASSALRVRLPPAEEADFEMALEEEWPMIWKIIARVDSRSAKCFTPDDEAMVHTAIERSLAGGHGELDAQLTRALRGWLAERGRAALARMPEGERGCSTLIIHLALMLHEMGDLEAAESLYREALVCHRATWGDSHPDTMTTMNNLSGLLAAKGDTEGSAQLGKEVLELRRATLGDRDPKTLVSRVNYGTRLLAQGDREGAAQVLRDAARDSRATLGDRHPTTLQAEGHLATILCVQGDPKGGAQLYRKALEKSRATLGDRHPDTLNLILAFGYSLHMQNDWEGSARLFQEALKGMRVVMGDQHPLTLRALHMCATLGDEHPQTRQAADNLMAAQGAMTASSNRPTKTSNPTKALVGQGKFKEAERQLREELEVRRATLGDHRPETLNSMSNLGHVLKKQGKFQEAASLLREGLEACRVTLGSRNEITLDLADNLGRVLQDQGKLEEAEVLLREVLEGRLAMLGHWHTHTVRSLNNLGLLLSLQGKFEEAAPLLRGALEALRVTLGDRHSDTLVTVNNLGELLMNQGKLEEAAPLLREALEANRATLGNRHRATLISICSMAQLLHRQGKIDEAEVLYREDLEGSRATLGDRHPDTLTSINNLAGLLFSQNKLKGALPLYLEAVEGRRATLGDRHPDTISSLMLLKMLSSKLGLLDEPLLSKLEPDSAAASSSPIPSAGGLEGVAALEGQPGGELIGEQVLVHGLVAKPELNNRTGTAAGWDSERGRYSVRLQDGSLLSLKPTNLQRLDTALVRPTTADEEERMLEEALAASMQGLTATAKEPMDDEEAEMAAALALSMQQHP